MDITQPSIFTLGVRTLGRLTSAWSGPAGSRATSCEHRWPPAAHARVVMSPDPVHISYELSRRQRLVAHLGTWLCYWPGLLLMLAVPAIVVTLAVLKSPWFLLLLLLHPLLNNLPRFVAGLLTPLLFGPERMDVAIEEDRIGYLIGQDRLWLPLQEIVRMERFGDVWAIVSTAANIYIPVSAVEEKHIAHMRAMSERGRKGQGLRHADDHGDATGNREERR